MKQSKLHHPTTLHKVASMPCRNFWRGFSVPRKGVIRMAKTDGGLKKVHVPAHTKADGTPVREHYRSTPNNPPAKPAKK